MLKPFAKFCALILVIANVASAQETSSTKTVGSSPKETCSISGLVVKSETNEPLKKAGVYLRKLDDLRSGYVTHTDATGHFAIDRIEPGRYDLRVGHTGYLSQSYGENSATHRGSTLTLATGSKVSVLLFRLLPWGVISGRITDENGDPFPNASVEAMYYFVSKGKRQLRAVDNAAANDLGEFRLYGLARGRYFVQARSRDGRFVNQLSSLVGDEGPAGETGYAPLYYPGTPDLARAVAVDVASGQEVPAIDFTLIPIRTFRVAGHVFDATLGQPAKECLLFLEHRDSTMEQSFSNLQGQTDCNKGNFLFTNVPPGSYFVFASSMGPNRQQSIRAAIEVESSNVTDVGITLLHGTNLAGNVFVEGREPVDFAELRVWLSETEESLFGGPNTTVKPDGTIILEHIPVGTFQVEVTGSTPRSLPDFYVKAARLNGEDVLEKGLTIGTGGTHGPLEIIFSSSGARAEGIVTDENDLPSAGATVALVPEEPRRGQFRLYKDAPTDQYGKFSIRGVAPGKYKLFSWKDVESDSWEDPDFLKPFENQGTEITAEENGHLSLTLKVLPSDKPKN
jgi:protocatechuate 3,4-dioxygenase beta subunit